MQRPPKHVELQCCRCGKSFLRLRKEYENSLRRRGTTRESRYYCSNSCREVGGIYNKCPLCGEWKAQMARACKACYLKDKHVKVNCTHCKKDFMKVSAEFRKGEERSGNQNHFCTKECYEVWRATRPRRPVPLTGTCNTCKSPCLGKRKYCSTECYSKRKAKNVTYVGEWSSRKHFVRKRDNGICAYCQRIKERVAVHHINQDATDNRLENLILLCEPCHNHYHHTASEPVQRILRSYFEGLVTG